MRLFNIVVELRFQPHVNKCTCRSVNIIATNSSCRRKKVNSVGHLTGSWSKLCLKIYDNYINILNTFVQFLTSNQAFYMSLQEKIVENFLFILVRGTNISTTTFARPSNLGLIKPHTTSVAYPSIECSVSFPGIFATFLSFTATAMWVECVVI